MKAPTSKVGIPEKVSRVRISPSPSPFAKATGDPSEPFLKGRGLALRSSEGAKEGISAPTLYFSVNFFYKGNSRTDEPIYTENMVFN